MTDFVECHSDYTYAERPIALNWEGQRRKIIKILAEWRTPAGKRFRVCTSDGQEFELSYHDSTNEWQIHQP